MITYKETLDLGFKRNDLGGDEVWFNEFGYECFITKKTICKLKGGSKIVAQWCPDYKVIELLLLDRDHFISNTITVNSVEKFKELTQIFNKQTNE